MLRSAVAITVGALIVSWAGLPHDTSLREHMVPVKMGDGHILHVSPIEVTTADWAHCVRDKGCSYSPRASVTSQSEPMTGVNFFDVSEYLAWANARGGGSFRLPTREEWRWLNRSLEKPKPAPLFTDPRLAWAANYGQEESPGGPVRKSALSPQQQTALPISMAMCGNGQQLAPFRDLTATAARDCPAFVAEGAHEAEIPVFLRNPAAGGCATGTPPTYLGLRLVSDE